MLSIQRFPSDCLLAPLMSLKDSNCRFVAWLSPASRPFSSTSAANLKHTLATRVATADSRQQTQSHNGRRHSEGQQNTWCFTVSCLTLTGTLGSRPSSSLRPLFSRILLPGFLLFCCFLEGFAATGLSLSSMVRLLMVNGSLNCQDMAA